MMFRHLFHFLFGWNYVTFKFGGDDTIARLRKTPDGESYVVRCGTVYFEDSYRGPFKPIIGHDSR